MDETLQLATGLKEEWGVSLPETFTEEEVIRLLAERVTVLIESGPEQFMQLMYRLDVSEKKLHGVMHEADVAGKIARLIYDRQMQKVKSRQQYKSTTPKDPDLEW